MKFSNRKNPDNDFGGLLFPTIVRVAAKTMAADLVPVKPMSAPTGKIYYYGNETEEEKQARLALERSESRKKMLDEVMKDLNEKGLN